MKHGGGGSVVAMKAGAFDITKLNIQRDRDEKQLQTQIYGPGGMLARHKRNLREIEKEIQKTQHELETIKTTHYTGAFRDRAAMKALKRSAFANEGASMLPSSIQHDLLDTIRRMRRKQVADVQEQLWDLDVFTRLSKNPVAMIEEEKSRRTVIGNAGQEPAEGVRSDSKAPPKPDKRRRASGPRRLPSLKELGALPDVDKHKPTVVDSDDARAPLPAAATVAKTNPPAAVANATPTPNAPSNQTPVSSPSKSLDRSKTLPTIGIEFANPIAGVINRMRTSRLLPVSEVEELQRQDTDVSRTSGKEAKGREARKQRNAPAGAASKDVADETTSRMQQQLKQASNVRYLRSNVRRDFEIELTVEQMLAGVQMET